jgi:hypothetical protein
MDGPRPPPSTCTCPPFRPLTCRKSCSVQYKETIVLFEQIHKAKGVLANTFEWLEPAAVKATKDGSPRPGVPLPRLFCIGPLVDEERGRELECLTWLDSQPAESVVFLCFGSASSVPAEGDRRGAGEERARVPLGRARARGPPRRLDEAVRRARRGGALLHARPVVSTWAAQVQALRHRATGAFVTHCGWNSKPEALAAGVPLVCWPMYAVQKLNKVLLVEDAKLGVAMRGLRRGDGGGGGGEGPNGHGVRL